MFLIVRAVVEMDLSLETLRKKMGVKDKLWENIAKRDKNHMKMKMHQEMI